MGILDDLKNQSEAQKTGEKNEKQRLAGLEQYYQDNIRPKMLLLYNFLNELVEHLNYLKKSTIASYPVYPDGSTQTFSQSDYKVTIDSTNIIKNINFSFLCNLEKTLKLEVENEERIERYTEVLNSFRIPFDRQDTKDNDYCLIKSGFEIKGPIRVHVVFKANIENSSIDMLLTNLDNPGTQKYKFTERHITEEFIDGLGKYILRENPSFLKLDINEEDKEEIRKQVQLDLKRRNEELEAAELRIKTEADNEKELKSWKNIFKKKS